MIDLYRIAEMMDDIMHPWALHEIYVEDGGQIRLSSTLCGYRHSCIVSLDDIKADGYVIIQMVIEEMNEKLIRVYNEHYI